jgi:large subunit ribosomal protein L18
MRVQEKQRLAQLRRWRVRKNLSGTQQRPRMSVKFTGEHIYVQFIDDEAGRTLASASTRHKGVPNPETLGANVAGAKIIGGLAAQAAKAVGIASVVFDRGSLRFHGKVKALADAAREAGLQF